MITGNDFPHFSPQEVVQKALVAERRVRPAVRVTPIRESAALGEAGGCRCFLKLENRQVTGSFKSRGAFSFLTGMEKKDLRHGVVTASTGNHGMAVAWAGKEMGAAVEVVMPENGSRFKMRRLEALGARLRLHGHDVVESEAFARCLAESGGLTYIPPYNHPLILGGQAGIAQELENQLGGADHILVPVGGGGLIAGIAGWCAERNPSTRLIGCQPGNSRVMADSVRAGRILDLPSHPTLAAAAAGGIEPYSITFPLCRDHVHDWELISEEEIREAMDFVQEAERIRIEGAAALPVAAFLRNPRRFSGTTVVLIISGGNVDKELES